MFDDAPDCGESTLGGLIFGTLIGVAVGAIGGYALTERLRKHENENREVER